MHTMNMFYLLVLTKYFCALGQILHDAPAAQPIAAIALAPALPAGAPAPAISPRRPDNVRDLASVCLVGFRVVLVKVLCKCELFDVLHVNYA